MLYKFVEYNEFSQKRIEKYIKRNTEKITQRKLLQIENINKINFLCEIYDDGIIIRDLKINYMNYNDFSTQYHIVNELLALSLSKEGIELEDEFKLKLALDEALKNALEAMADTAYSYYRENISRKISKEKFMETIFNKKDFPGKITISYNYNNISGNLIFTIDNLGFKNKNSVDYIDKEINNIQGGFKKDKDGRIVNKAGLFQTKSVFNGGTGLTIIKGLLDNKIIVDFRVHQTEKDYLWYSFTGVYKKEDNTIKKDKKVSVK